MAAGRAARSKACSSLRRPARASPEAFDPTIMPIRYYATRRNTRLDWRGPNSQLLTFPSVPHTAQGTVHITPPQTELRDALSCASSPHAASPPLVSSGHLAAPHRLAAARRHAANAANPTDAVAQAAVVAPLLAAPPLQRRTYERRPALACFFSFFFFSFFLCFFFSRCSLRIGEALRAHARRAHTEASATAISWVERMVRSRPQSVSMRRTWSGTFSRRT